MIANLGCFDFLKSLYLDFIQIYISFLLCEKEINTALI